MGNRGLFSGFSSKQPTETVKTFTFGGTPAGWTLNNLAGNSLYGMDGRLYASTNGSAGGRASCVSNELFPRGLSYIEMTCGIYFANDAWICRTQMGLSTGVGGAAATNDVCHMSANSAYSQTPNGKFFYCSQRIGGSGNAVAAANWGHHIFKLRATPFNVEFKVFNTAGVLLHNLIGGYLPGMSLGAVKRIVLDVYASNTQIATMYGLTVRYA